MKVRPGKPSCLNSPHASARCHSSGATPVRVAVGYFLAETEGAPRLYNLRKSGEVFQKLLAACLF
jgi:hypothetical protein